jgi:hypothetical protein
MLNGCPSMRTFSTIIVLLAAMHLQESSARDALALGIVFDHPAVNTHPRVLCAAARTCKAWQEAVRHCGACNTAVVLPLRSELPQLCSFVRWLQNHAALVSSVTVTDGRPCRAEWTAFGREWQNHVEVFQQLLQQAMQLAAVLPVTAAAAAAAQTGVVNQPQRQQQVPGLRLTSYIDLPGDTSILAALPAHSLTRPDLDFRYSRVISGAALSAALARLSNLQQLHLTTRRDAAAIPGCCLSSVAQLTALTSLQLDGYWSEYLQPLQQLLAQPLPLLQLHVDLWDLPVLDRSGLTRLTQLAIGALPDGLRLPNQLQHLQLLGVGWAGTLETAMHQQQLQQIQRLAFCVDSARIADAVSDSPVSLSAQQQLGAVNKALLLRVGTLPNSQSLQLEYLAPKSAADTAAAWPQLPQLDDLWMSFRVGYPTERQMTAILAALAAATSLIKLQLHICVKDDADRYARHALQSTAACARLSSLARLKDLTVCKESVLLPGDALALTALTGLTRLALQGAETCVTDEVAAALARSLTQLQHLDLRRCPVGSCDCFDEIGELTQLTELRLAGALEVDNYDLMRLTGLTNLQQLAVDIDNEYCIAEEALEEFWEAVRQQQQL